MLKYNISNYIIYNFSIFLYKIKIFILIIN